MKNNITKELSGRVSSVSRTESPTMVEIIEKFHRIKEERFKSKENVFLNHNGQYDGRFTRHSDLAICQRSVERPLSATQKMRNFLTASVLPKRRNSLPSLFKLETPPSLEKEITRKTEEKGMTETEATKTEVKNNNNEQSRKIVRRYSMSHTVQEYSKRDIKQLIRAGRRASLEPLVVKPSDPLVAKPNPLLLPKSVDEDEEENMKKWLTGDDLHYFYTMWDIKKKHKLRFPKKLPPVHNCVSNITEEDLNRPRLYTL